MTHRARAFFAICEVVVMRCERCPGWRKDGRSMMLRRLKHCVKDGLLVASHLLHTSICCLEGEGGGGGLPNPYTLL